MNSLPQLAAESRPVSVYARYQVFCKTSELQNFSLCLVHKNANGSDRPARKGQAGSGECVLDSASRLGEAARDSGSLAEFPQRSSGSPCGHGPQSGSIPRMPETAFCSPSKSSKSQFDIASGAAFQLTRKQSAEASGQAVGAASPAVSNHADPLAIFFQKLCGDLSRGEVNKYRVQRGAFGVRRDITVEESIRKLESLHLRPECPEKGRSALSSTDPARTTSNHIMQTAPSVSSHTSSPHFFYQGEIHATSQPFISPEGRIPGSPNVLRNFRNAFLRSQVHEPWIGRRRSVDRQTQDLSSVRTGGGSSLPPEETAVVRARGVTEENGVSL